MSLHFPPWLIRKYINLFSHKLEKFDWKKRGQEAWARCPFCGDSKKNQLKRRFYLYVEPEGFTCFNCSMSGGIPWLIRKFDEPLYNSMIAELMADARPPAEEEPEPVTPNTRKPQAMSLLSVLSRDPSVIPVRDYVASRGLPESVYGRLFVTNSARSWLTKLDVDADKAKAVDDRVPYLVIPLRLQDGAWYGAQLRALDKKVYHTFRWATELKIFGLDRWNPGQPTIVMEGPLDAICVPNALAACSSDLRGAVRVAGENGINIPKPIYWWDNEPRNPDVCRLMKAAIAAGERVIIWPGALKQFKDIGDLMKIGADWPMLSSVAVEHNYRGLQAELKFVEWQGGR